MLPEANDEWASDASEFDTLAELRSDMADRLTSLKKLEARLLLRERAIEALAELVTEEMPATLVAAAAERARDALAHRLADRGATIDQYLEASGEDEEELAAELERQAASQVRIDLALRALADAEEIEVDDQDLAAEIERLASQTNQDARSLATRLARTGGLEQLRSDVRNEKAVAGSPTRSTSSMSKGPRWIDRCSSKPRAPRRSPRIGVDVEVIDAKDDHADAEAADVEVIEAKDDQRDVEGGDSGVAGEEAVGSAPSKEG